MPGAKIKVNGVWIDILGTKGDPGQDANLGDVLSMPLTGLSTATSTDITSSDTILQAFGKLQGQLGDVAAALDELNG